MEEIQRTYDAILERLKKSGLIEKINEFELKPQIDRSIILKMYDSPSKIFLDDGGLFFLEGEDKIYCPEIHVTVSEKGEWLSEYVPQIMFDVDQSGNVRKAEEAESLYCLIVVANTFKDASYKRELDEIIKDYDFINMKPMSENGETFSTLLTRWQGLQSVAINILISACRYAIVDFKKSAEKFLKSGLTDSEVAELRDLESKIRAINFEYSEGVLSPNKIKMLSKIERLTKINERDEKISTLIKMSKVGTLFKILNLSSEYVSPINKKRIQTWVDAEVTAYLQEKDFKNLKEDRVSIVSQMTRRAIKLEVMSLRRKNVELYINDKKMYKLPSKM